MASMLNIHNYILIAYIKPHIYIMSEYELFFYSTYSFRPYFKYIELEMPKLSINKLL